MTLRPCITCGTLTNVGSRCPTHQIRRDRGRPWRRLRAQILTRDRYRCRACGEPAEHVDHVVPIARGGIDDPSNLEALCAACNLAKGDR